MPYFNSKLTGPGYTVPNLKLQIFLHMPKFSFFQFLEEKPNILHCNFYQFWPYGKMVDQLVLAVLYEFTLKFFKKMKNLHAISQIIHRERHTSSKSDNRNLKYNYYCHFTVIMDIIQSQ